MTTDPIAQSATRSRDSAHAFVLVALMAALMAALGLVPKIDLAAGVPITLQSLGVMLAGCLLGGWRGFQAMALFLLAVAAGLPLLAGGRGGLGVFAGPTVGYLAGYALGALATGAVMQRLPSATPRAAMMSAAVAALLGGVLCVHLCGIVGLMAVAGMTLQKAVMVDIVFIPGDLVKVALCAAVVHAIARGLPDWRLSHAQK